MTKVLNLPIKLGHAAVSRKDAVFEGAVVGGGVQDVVSRLNPVLGFEFGLTERGADVDIHVMSNSATNFIFGACRRNQLAERHTLD